MDINARFATIALQCSVIAIFLSSLGACANRVDSMPVPVSNPKASANAGIAPLLSVSAPGSERFFAVGRLHGTKGEGWNCTATLFASSETPNDNQRARILSAGHCARMTGDNEVVIDQPMGEGWKFTAKYFHDNKDEHVQVPIERIVYSTMKSTDVAVMELGVTYGFMKSLGIKPLLLEELKTTDSTNEAVHIPMGLFPGGFFLRHSICQALSPQAVFEGFQPIREDTPWFFPQAIPTDCIGVYGGSSGAPVFAKDGTRVIGVLSTAVTPNFNGCGWGRPCEVNANGVISRPEAVYFVSVGSILKALESDNTLDLSKLDPGTGVALERTGSWSTQAQIKGEDGNVQPAKWNLKINDGFEFIRYKTGPAYSTRCELAKGYGAPLRAADQPLIELPVGPEEGVRSMCVIGIKPDETASQPMPYATVKLREIDNTPPVHVPEIAVQENGDRWGVLLQLTANENARANIKYGPQSTTECANMDGYQAYDVSFYLSKDRQWRVCAFGEDEAGNPGPIVSKDI
ncbi:trypsin [Pseudomonas sp. C2B4]|uniref:trypsin n=1 Tax=Pseudomonas sp. C2B4 TaxID=2735270 RepID=UPI001586BAC1|nr:trypsin [Pseudomonas sp. C2B4]NUU35857.1 trypsin [Pseudomonas sp. C2B4]